MDENVYMRDEDVAWVRKGVDVTTVDIYSVDLVDNDVNMEDID